MVPKPRNGLLLIAQCSKKTIEQTSCIKHPKGGPNHNIANLAQIQKNGKGMIDQMKSKSLSGMKAGKCMLWLNVHGNGNKAPN